jgi:predicted acyltransferase
MWPLPAADFDFEAVGVPKDWPHLMTGFAAHWNKNMNPAWAFDVWFLNLFPRPKTFAFHSGGYATLSFVPTLATMIMGLLAGGVLARAALKSSSSYGMRVLLLATLGAALFAGGWALDHFGICPNVKRIWTPAFALFSGGICFIWIAVLHLVCDCLKLKAWAYLFMIIGSNSIIAYVMSGTLEKPIKELLVRHLGETPFLIRGEVWEPVLLGAAVLTLMWLILFWLNRQRIYVRI